MKCNRCGRELGVYDKYCSFCGNLLNNNYNYRNEQMMENDDDSIIEEKHDNNISTEPIMKVKNGKRTIFHIIISLFAFLIFIDTFMNGIRCLHIINNPSSADSFEWFLAHFGVVTYFVVAFVSISIPIIEIIIFLYDNNKSKK